MKAVVTGATGFVGGHVARLLAERGDEVTATYRNPERLSRLRELDVREVKADVLDRAETLVPEAVAGLRALHALLAERGVAERVIFDLGLIRSLGYYTGAVFEVYDAALGAPLGGGGRYDDLLGRFGRDLPACGWAMNVERLHIARVGEGR